MIRFSHKTLPTIHFLPAVAVALALVCIDGFSLHAADPDPIRGPFWSGTIMRGKDQPAAMKGLAVTLGYEPRSYVVYDLDTLRLAVGWTGDFLEFGNTLTKIEWPPPPSVKGDIAFATEDGPGWSGPSSGKEVTISDPRVHQQG